MFLKTIVNSFIVLQLLCNHMHAMDAAVQEQIRQDCYQQTLVQNNDTHNRFEKITWSDNGKFVASYRYINEKCEIYIWNLHKANKNNCNIAKPHITILNAHIINLFWSLDNEQLIVVCRDAVYMYRIMNKYKGKIKLTPLPCSSINICAACQKHKKTHLALALFDNETNSNQIYLIDLQNQTLDKISLKNTTLENILPISMTWSDSHDKIHVLFANSGMLHINPQDPSYNIDLKSNATTPPFIPYSFEYFHSLLLEYFDLSQIISIPHRHSDTIITCGNCDKHSGLYLLNLNTGRREIIARNEKNPILGLYLMLAIKEI